MYAAPLFPFVGFWRTKADDPARTAPPKRHAAPIFIGDAVQSFGGDTLLLKLLRDAQIDASDGPDHSAE